MKEDMVDKVLSLQKCNEIETYMRNKKKVYYHSPQLSSFIIYGFFVQMFGYVTRCALLCRGGSTKNPPLQSFHRTKSGPGLQTANC